MFWQTAALISCRTTPKWSSPLIHRLPATHPVAPEHEGVALGAYTPTLPEMSIVQQIRAVPETPRLQETPTLRGASRIESVTSVYFETGCDGAADGRHITRGYCELHAAARFRVA